MADFLVLIMHTYMEFVSTIFHADANAVSMMIDFFIMHSRQNAERYIHNQTGKRFLRSYRHTAHAEPPNTEPPQSKKPHHAERMERRKDPQNAERTSCLLDPERNEAHRHKARKRHTRPLYADLRHFCVIGVQNSHASIKDALKAIYKVVCIPGIAGAHKPIGTAPPRIAI